MTAPALIEEGMSWCPRERRSTHRWTVNHSHRAEVILARALFLAVHGSVPRWAAPAGLRTVRLIDGEVWVNGARVNRQEAAA